MIAMVITYLLQDTLTITLRTAVFTEIAILLLQVQATVHHQASNSSSGNTNGSSQSSSGNALTRLFNLNAIFDDKAS